MSYQLLYPDIRDVRGPLEPDYPSLGMHRGGDEFSVQYRPTHKPVRPRLFVGSLSEEVDEKEVRALFSKFGNLIDCYVNPAKNFAFLRMDSREGALRAQETLDGMVIHGRAMRVRRAPHNACIWVGNLPPTVSNELLYEAFTQFGEVERAVVVCDERGRSKGYGFVEFARKTSFQNAIKKCSTDFFLLTRSMKPVRVEAWEHVEDETGLEAKTLVRYPGIEIQLSVPPRFARPGELEYSFAQKWKALHEEEKKLKNELRQRIAEKRHQLEKEENAAFQREGKRVRDRERHEIERQERYLQEQQIRLRQQQLALSLGGSAIGGSNSGTNFRVTLGGEDLGHGAIGLREFGGGRGVRGEELGTRGGLREEFGSRTLRGEFGGRGGLREAKFGGSRELREELGRLREELGARPLPGRGLREDGRELRDELGGRGRGLLRDEFGGGRGLRDEFVGEYGRYDLDPIDRLERGGEIGSLEGISGVYGAGGVLGGRTSINGYSGLGLRPGEGYPRDRLAALEELTYASRRPSGYPNGLTVSGVNGGTFGYSGGSSEQYGNGIEGRPASWETEGSPSPVASRTTSPAPGESPLAQRGNGGSSGRTSALSTPDKPPSQMGRRGSIPGPSYEQPGLHQQRRGGGGSERRYTDPPAYLGLGISDGLGVTDAGTSSAMGSGSSGTINTTNNRLKTGTGGGGRKRSAENSSLGPGNNDSRRR